jgi:hypothetical protein
MPKNKKKNKEYKKKFKRKESEYQPFIDEAEEEQ